MNHIEQITHFHSEISKVVKRFTSEYELPAVSAVGVLLLEARLIQDNVIKESEDNYDE